ncbi:MAG: F0F1 ATP synthase subunit gamma [Candidatus Levybacteria bacterium]|nr:F0F1 ATP synthase subunit gamma [Candidatus Levybacteria bacterium]
MVTKKIIQNEIDNLVGLSNMVLAYEEIAASRIRNSRSFVLSNRAYMSEIREIFEEVISSYKRELEVIIKAKKRKEMKEFSFLNRNGKTLYLLISANTGLYGGLIKKTFDLFVENSKNTSADKAVIGKLGLAMWQGERIKDKYYYFDFPDQRVDSAQLKNILNFIISYEKVIVFYGQFRNLIKQEATFSDISGSFNTEKSQTDKKIKYFFEPSIPKILEFFEKQIFSSIFEQTMRESQLAKIASRLTTLDKASENIEKELLKATSIRSRSIHHEQNKKQLQTFSSRLLWGKF